MAKKKEIIEHELIQLYKDRGRLDATDIVEVAQARNHPLHKYFEWDNKKAGEKYRLAQAEGMIRFVKIRVIEGDEDYKVRVFHPMRSVGREGPGYVHIDDIQDDPQAKALLLQTMQRDWIAMKRRYGQMDEFWDLVKGGVEVSM